MMIYNKITDICLKAALLSLCLLTQIETLRAQEEPCLTVDVGPDWFICPEEFVFLEASILADNCDNGGGGTDVCFQPEEPAIDCSECDLSLSGSDWVTINAGTKACVKAGETFTGGLNLNGGTLVVCGDINPSNVNYEGGDIIVTGSALFTRFENLNMNNERSRLINYGNVAFINFTFNGLFENHGTSSAAQDFNINAPASFVNKGFIEAGFSFNNNGISDNMGKIHVMKDVKNNGSATFNNFCEIRAEEEYHNNSLFINGGKVSAGTITYLNGGSHFNAEPGSLLETTDIHFNGTVESSQGACAKIEVANRSTINGGAEILGTLDYCDMDGTLETMDIAFGENVLTDCGCTATGIGGGGTGSGNEDDPDNEVEKEYTYLWSPAEGLDDPTSPTPISSPINDMVYKVTITDQFGNTATDDVEIVVFLGCGIAPPVEKPFSIVTSTNPFRESTTITIVTQDKENAQNAAQLVVTDFAGRVVYTKENFPVNVPTELGKDLASNLYVLKVNLGNDVDAIQINKLY